MSATTVAIYKFDPDATFSFLDGNEWYGGITWSSPAKQPTQEVFDNAVRQIQYEFDLAECHAKREAAYPSIGDQLDALYHAGVFPPEMAAKIEAVKETYPKPQGGA